ncbi:site-specific integrase [Corynebacterium aquatimens]|uniref:site-specific integrase n=1 Tax=Corynebacterium aquatimens TaxID=1190508 RepID=UPI00254118D4|nr:site-specific integrase [Corynebacterium aquatimens]QYH19305.1 site-specific integrase [Corynebacterium aquatimens]
MTSSRRFWRWSTTTPPAAAKAAAPLSPLSTLPRWNRRKALRGAFDSSERVDLDAEAPTAIVRPTKDGGTSTRVVQLPKIAADAARDQLRDTGGTFDWLFPTSTGTHISKSTAERWMREARHEWEKANEAKGRPDVSWVTFHTMRKHVATVLSERVSVNAATQQLGHADTTVTQHHYISRPKAGPAVAEVLNDHLFPSESGQKVAK